MLTLLLSMNQFYLHYIAMICLGVYITSKPDNMRFNSSFGKCLPADIFANRLIIIYWIGFKHVATDVKTLSHQKTAISSSTY